MADRILQEHEGLFALPDPAVAKPQLCACVCMAVYWIKEKSSDNVKL